MSRRVPLHGLLTVMVLTMIAPPAPAQSLQDRIEHVRRQRAQQAAAPDVVPAGPSIHQRLAAPLPEVRLEHVTPREALRWWSRTTGVNLVVHWPSLELEGIDPDDDSITINLRNVPAGQLLAILLRQAAPPEATLMYEVTPWYVQVMTRAQANRQTVVRVYDVRDLLMVIPDFEPPSFSLRDALGDGRDGGGGTSLFDDEDEQGDERLTRQERGEALAQLVRDTIEPDIWKANGGEFASIRYHDGRLIVDAPRYVHRQIGAPTPAPRRRVPAAVVPATPGRDIGGDAGDADPVSAGRR